MKYEKQKNQLIKIYERHQNTPYIKWLCNNMLMTANIKRSFTNTFTKVHDYRFSNDRFAYIMRTIRFANMQWFGMMTILFTIWTFRLRSLQELIDLLTFNGLTCWLTILALLILVLLTIVGQTGLLTVNSSASLLTLLTLQEFCLLTLLEHTPLTGLHWYKRFTFPRTLDKITIHLAMTWLLQFPDLETGRPTLVNWGKSSSLKEKEILPGMDYWKTSLYNVLRIFNEKFIWLFCAVNVATIDFSSLTFPCTTRCMESL